MWAHETERVQLKLKNTRWYFFCDILQFSNITWGFEESWNFFAFFIKEETNLLGLLMKEAGCKYFMMRAVKKYWMDRQHWRAAFVLHQNTRKFYLEIVVCYFRKRDRVQCGEGRDGGGGGVISFHPLSLDHHEFLCRAVILESSGFSLPLKIFPHEGILHAVDFLDHHITHRRFE